MRLEIAGHPIVHFFEIVGAYSLRRDHYWRRVGEWMETLPSRLPGPVIAGCLRMTNLLHMSVEEREKAPFYDQFALQVFDERDAFLAEPPRALELRAWVAARRHS